MVIIDDEKGMHFIMKRMLAKVNEIEIVGSFQETTAAAETAGELSFSDEANIGKWAKAAVGRAVQAGIIKGYADGSFRPNALLSRSEMAVMIVRLLALDEAGEAGAIGFADDEDIPTWAKRYVWAAKQHGLVQGMGANQFAPAKSLTRAEAVVVLLRSLENQSSK
ncbi:S-layer homology domain-containing protein [Paenibacillus baekrokdamisoli]|uniref:S-layer homology domain-containing protein n=1 Tax=Paenibacillus baekrokdamisoli TaxID=1712516 RepID=UPI001E3B1AD0|nr:S-layer homology domain-containing protein [Paenibacillus baekrokdamisoli]